MEVGGFRSKLLRSLLRRIPLWKFPHLGNFWPELPRSPSRSSASGEVGWKVVLQEQAHKHKRFGPVDFGQSGIVPGTSPGFCAEEAQFVPWTNGGQWVAEKFTGPRCCLVLLPSHAPAAAGIGIVHHADVLFMYVSACVPTLVM